MDLTAALDWLYGLQRFGIKLGLENISELLERLGNPHHRFPAVHVAGTNGKGSVCAYLDGALRAAGYRVGLYTSPHLVRFNERIAVGGEPIDDGGLLRLLERVRPEVEAMGAGDPARFPTFFEVATALGFLHFAERGVEIAVVEVGMGGRLDATNVVQPRVTVVTRLGLEHTEWLGRTIRAIAGEKAGILKRGVPCATLRQPGLGVVRRRARALGAPLVVIPDDVGFRRLAHDEGGQTVEVRGRLGTYGLRVPLAGAHQAENAALAVAALELLRGQGWRLPTAALRRGIASTHWPARLEVRWRHPLTIVDCTHTTQGARVTARAVREDFAPRRLILVVGILRDKDLPGMMRHLAPLASEAICVRPRTERAFAPEALAAELGKREVPARIIPDVAEGLAAAMALAGVQGTVLVTGSLYTAGEALAYLEGRWRGRVEETLRILQATHMPGAFPGEVPATTLAKVRKATEDPFKVLITTILSQRTRDPVTEEAAWRLFGRYPDPGALARAPLRSIERLIRPVNFYPTKARAIREVARALMARHGGRVPRAYGELLELPMVGPKTAACVLVYGFGDASHIPVDTHAHRIPNRLGWVRTSEPEETERELARIVPREYSLAANELLVRHGQTICLPLNPHCHACPVNRLCDQGLEVMAKQSVRA